MKPDRSRFDEVRRDRSALESALQALGSRVHGTMANCPNHDDKNPSASIHDDGGVWRVRCFVCEQSWDVFDLQAMQQGSTSGDVMREIRKGEPQQQIITTAKPPVTERKSPKQTFPSIDAARHAFGAEAVYEYTAPEAARPDMVIFRLKGTNGRNKKFIQCHFTDAGLVMEAPPDPKPIYNRIALAKSDMVIVVEGEKCADELSFIGMVATTSPGGAGKASHADWSPLAGKTAYLWPDNDPIDAKTGKSKGVEHMREVAQILERLNPPALCLWIEPTGLGLPEKGDVADLLEELQSKGPDECRQVIQGILDDAEPMGASRELSTRLEDIIAGRHVSVPFPWKLIGDMTKALLPGTITLIGGPGGATKSFFIMQCITRWIANHIQCAAYMLEDDRAYHLHRALCQIVGNGNLFDDEWVRANADYARLKQRENSRTVDAIGRGIFDAPDTQVDLEHLAQWVEERAAAGARVLVIDPVTAAATDEAKAWVADLRFIMAVKKSMRQHGASLILLTHPKKGAPQGRKGGGSMDDLAGGAAYQRFAHTVLYLEPCDSSDQAVVFQQGDHLVIGQRAVNRVLKIYKARNGRGTGANIGMFFNGGTLRFRLLGQIPRKGEYYPQAKPDEDDVSATPNPIPRHERLANADEYGPPPF